MLLQRPPDNRIVRPDQLDRPGVAELRRHLGRPDHVGEHDGAEGGVVDRLGVCRGRIVDAAEKCLDRRQVDLDHFVGHVAMGLGMDPVGGLLVRRIDQTERRLALGIVPVGQELHAVLVLDFQVLDVQLGGFLRGLLDHVVPVQENGHRRPPPVGAVKS